MVNKNEKPKFLSEVKISNRPEIKAVTLKGKGYPKLSFNRTVEKISEWLKSKGVDSIGPTMGIFYQNSDVVGVENIEWDAAIPVSKQIITEGNFEYKKFPAQKVISVTLTGEYLLMTTAFNYLVRKSKEESITTKWPLTEIYHSEKIPLVTELQLLVE